MLSYTFPIYPNKEQKGILETTFDLCRFTYNSLLEELQKQDAIDRSRIQHKIVELKDQHPELDKVYSKTLQYECYRLFSNLSVLKGLKKRGRKVGKLRFKGKQWFNTIVYNHSGFEFAKVTEKKGVINLSKIGKIRVKTHREISGNIKQLIIKRSCGKWYLILQTDAKRDFLKCGNKGTGIDLGIESYLTESNGNKVDNPKTLERHLGKLKEIHQNIARCKKGSKNREKAKLRLQKLHAKISNIRKDFIHKTTTSLIRQNCFIAVEKLNIREMMEEPHYNARNIADASWNRFLQVLRYKAESAGCEVVEVDPRNTSKACSNCGNIQEMPLYARTYDCSACHMSMDRDHNSAINILKKASEGLEWASAETANVPSMKQEATAFRQW
ncbi:MAG: transposase [Candidatus Micrarchaeales archaeon]|jgi:putative transposase